MFGLSAEHIVILVIILLLFGPKRLPELGNTLGKAIKNFKDSLNAVKEPEFKHILEDDSKAEHKTAVNTNVSETVTDGVERVKKDS
jgi:sec-independent protein translocase protein TatA